jgi:hypothetical protein
MSSRLHPDQRERLEQLLYGLHCWEDPRARRVFLAGLLRGHPIWLDLRVDGNQREVAENLLTLFERASEQLVQGRPPLCALLHALGIEYGPHSPHQAEIAALTAELCRPSAQRPRVPWEGTPYRGLKVYERRHAPIYFGREAELQRLCDALATGQGRRFLFVVGASPLCQDSCRLTAILIV